MLGVATSNFITYVFDKVRAENGWYASLHYSNPSVDDPSATEVIGGSYTRQKLYWRTPDETSGPSVLVSSSAITWSGITPTTIVYVGIFDHPTDGNLMFRIPLATPVIVANNGSWTINAGELFISMA